MHTPDMFEGAVFALGLGQFRVTGEVGGKVRLTALQAGTVRIFEVDCDAAVKLSDCIRAIAACSRGTK